MRVAVQKWGNSLALRIPKSLAAGARIKQGSVVEVSVIKGNLVIALVAGSEFVLGQLLKGVNARNRHGEIIMGLRAGREGMVRGAEFAGVIPRQRRTGNDPLHQFPGRNRSGSTARLL